MKLSKEAIIDILVFAVTFLAGGIGSVLLGQDCNWDLKNYHYYNAYAFLHNRLMFDVAPAQFQTYHNPLLDVPFYLMSVSFMPIIGGFLLGGIHGVNSWMVYKISTYLLAPLPWSRRYVLSIAAGLTSLFGAVNLCEMGSTMGDNTTSLFVLGALIVWLSRQKRSFSKGGEISPLVPLLAGFILGIGTGLKLTLAVYAFVLKNETKIYVF